MRTARTLIPVLLALVPVSASAKPPPLDVTNGHISCDTIIGVMRFNPALVAGVASPEAMDIKVKASVAGCVVTGVADTTGFPPLVHTGTFSGTLTAPTNECGTFVTMQPLSDTMILTESIGALSVGCNEPKGLKTVHIGLGTVGF